ncbi:hypothetical protein ACFE04_016998 [Oxalis oulophora]
MSSSDEANVPRGNGNDQTSQGENGNNIKAQNFTFRELASATKNFKQECLLGEGGFGKVYRGMLHPSGQAQPMLRDPKRFPDMADPHLNKQFPEKSLNQAVAIAAMCVQEEPTARPFMSDVVTALSFLTAVEDAPSPIMPPVMSEELNNGTNDNNDDDSDSSDNEDEDNDGDGSSVYEDGMSEEGGNGKSKKWGSKSSHKSSSGRGSSLKKKTKKYFSLSRKSSKASKSKPRGGEEDENSSKSSEVSRNSSRSSHSTGKSGLSRAMSKASK